MGWAPYGTSVATLGSFSPRWDGPDGKPSTDRKYPALSARLAVLPIYSMANTLRQGSLVHGGLTALLLYYM